jgi:hypothetical protein
MLPKERARTATISLPRSFECKPATAGLAHRVEVCRP